MTYNIEMKGSESDGGWQNRTLSKVVETITTADPDVVGLQEDTDDWYAEESGYLWNKTYTNHLEGLETAGYASTNFGGYGKERLNIYYKSSKFNKEAYGTMLYVELAKKAGFTDVEPDYAEYHNADTQPQGRFFSWVVLTDKTTGVTVLVVNTHLHYKANDDNIEYAEYDDSLRAAQAKLLNAWLDSMAEQYPNQVVMGDMNNNPATQTLVNLSDGLEIARDDAWYKGDVGGTLASTTIYTRRDPEIFDHILYRNIEAIKYYVIDNKIDLVDGEYRYPSDHLPVYSEFICYAE